MFVKILFYPLYVYIDYALIHNYNLKEEKSFYFFPGCHLCNFQAAQVEFLFFQCYGNQWENC